MKKIIPFSVALLLFIACSNNGNNSKGVSGNDIPPKKTQVDSLMEQVMDGHNAGMAKMSKIRKMQKEVARVLDSMAALPVKAKQAAVPYKIQLDSLAAGLRYAEVAMDKWMEEFNMDSAVNNMGQRIKYLGDEKWKVGKVKEAILSSLQKADSLLKAKL